MRPLGALVAVLAVVRAAWTPELPPSAKGWSERIADELDRSLGAYARVTNASDAEALVGRLLADPLRGVLVVGDALVVDARLLANKKGLYHVNFLLSVMRREPLRNFASFPPPPPSSN